MKQIIIEVDDHTAANLEKYAPAKKRRRSEFVRDAIRKAIDLEIEKQMIEAYRRWPQDLDEPWPFDPKEWAPEDEAIHPDPPPTLSKTPTKKKTTTTTKKATTTKKKATPPKKKRR